MSTTVTATGGAGGAPDRTGGPADGWFRWSVAELTGALRRREVGTTEIAEALLRRIDDVEPQVRAYLHVDAESFRAGARAAQRVLDADADAAPPLTGVPVAIKDLIDIRGMHTTAGSRVLADNLAGQDAPVMRRWRKAGALVVGKANTHEFAYGGATEPTRNPWDTARMAGGSSGGNAAALAAGLCFGGLGSDTAGSIRIPANFCGVTGFKPSRGTVSARRVVPLAPSLDCVGPLGRSPADVAALHAALLGPARAARFADEVARRSIQGLRVGVLAPSGPVADCVLAAEDAAAEALAAAGARVTALDPVDHRLAVDVNFAIMAVESARVHRRWLRTHGDRYSTYVRERLEAGARVSAVDHLDALDQADRIRALWDGLFTEHDVVLLNGMPTTAPEAYVTRVEVGGTWEDRDWLMCRDTAFANVTGHPALAVPAGLDRGLPVGIQLVGPRSRDASLFAPGQVVHEALAPRIP